MVINDFVLHLVMVRDARFSLIIIVFSNDFNELHGPVKNSPD